MLYRDFQYIRKEIVNGYYVFCTANSVEYMLTAYRN